MSPATGHSPLPTVFVVDDDTAVRKAVSRLLRSVRIEVAVFASRPNFSSLTTPKRPGVSCSICRCRDSTVSNFSRLW